MAKPEKVTRVVSKERFTQEIRNLLKPLRIPTKLNDFDERIPHMKISREPIKFRGKTDHVVKYVSAAGLEEESVMSKLKEMTDNYLPETREGFTNAAYSDPTIAPSLEQRHNAFYENGFTLALSLKDTLDDDGKEMTPEEIQSKLDEYGSEYGKYLSMLKKWSIRTDISLLQHMKTQNITNVVQGKAMTLFTPSLSVLEGEDLPESLTTISTEEMGNPIIDTLNRKLVAVRVDLGKKKFALPDEMVYTVRKHWGLRKDSLFLGASSLEAVLQASKAFKRLINFDLPKALIASYLTKIIATVAASGSPQQQKDQIDSILSGIVDDATDLIGASADITFKEIRLPIDVEMVQMAFEILDKLLMSAAGSTKAQLGRTDNLNRDTATIMELANIKYIRNPDEELVSSAFENQLINPLFARLAGEEIDEMPVKIVFVRKEKQETSIKDDRLEKKQNMIDEKSNQPSEKAIDQDEDARRADFKA